MLRPRWLSLGLLLPAGLAWAQDEAPPTEESPAQESATEAEAKVAAKPHRRGGWVHMGFHHRIETNLGWGGFRNGGPGQQDWLDLHPDRGPYADGILIQVISRQGHGVGDDWTLGGYVQGTLGWNLTNPPHNLALINVGVGADLSRYLSRQNVHFDFAIGPQMSFGRDADNKIDGTPLWGFGSSLGVVQDVWFSDHNAFGFGVRAEIAYIDGGDLHVIMGGATLVLSMLTTKRALGKREQ